MIVKLFLSNNSSIKIRTKYVTLEGFAEDLAKVSSRTFSLDGDHLIRVGDFIDFYDGTYVKYDSIIAFEEVSENVNE